MNRKFTHFVILIQTIERKKWFHMTIIESQLISNSLVYSDA